MSSEIETPVSKPARSRKAGRVVLFCLRTMRNMAFMVWLVVGLISISVSAAVWATYATWQVAQLTYRVGEMAYQHRRAMVRVIAKARIRRLMVAIPVAGAAAAVYFERRTYYEWREIYPEGTAEDYACDMAALTAEVLDEVLQELPEAMPLSERRIRNLLPECNSS